MLFVRVPPIPAAIERTWNAWYDSEHIAYRMSLPGFCGARRYRVEEGAFRYLALYEIESVAVLSSPAYLAHRQWEAARPPESFEAIAPRLPGFARGVYEHRIPIAGGGGALDATAALFGDIENTMVRPDALQHWFETLHLPAVLHNHNVVAARLLTLSNTVLDGRSGHRTAKPSTIIQYDLR